MKRSAALMVVGVLLLGALAGTASAAPPNTTRLTLSCDRPTQSSSVVVTLRDTANGVDTAAGITLQCGTDPSIATRSTRRVETTALPVDYAIVGQFDVATILESVQCSAERTLPMKLSCSDSSGNGATLVIR